MLDRLRRHLSYANVMATVAVFIALGGSSYAVATLNGKQLKNRSVRASKVARNTLSGTEIRESRLGQVPNAARLGGVTASQLKVRCPVDTYPFSDVCVEKAPRTPSAYGNATATCGAFGTPQGPGRRLPTYGELKAALASFPMAPGGELTGDIIPSTSTLNGVDAIYISGPAGAIGVTPDTGAGAKAFRCVTDPLN